MITSSIVSARTSKTMTTAATNLISSLPGNRPQQTSQQQNLSAAGNTIPGMNTQFREIHKNTWLKRLTAEGRKICVGPKKSERSWVVFCVHDDTEAFLEGYAEPRQAPSHSPEWVVSMQDTLHISHALIPNSHEFEFVVTLSNEVVRFHAMSWDIMQEWVEALRSKLREMKILSPRENLYTKLPEVRAPLLPTRDPTSPLPAPPPVPAALVPGVERVIPPSVQQQVQPNTLVAENIELRNCVTASSSTEGDCPGAIEPTTSNIMAAANSTVANTTIQTLTTTSPHTTTALTHLTSMSNTLTQNFLNMLSDPISAYNEQLNDANSSSSSFEPDDIVTESSPLPLTVVKDLNLSDISTEEEIVGPLLRKASAVPSDLSAVFANNSVRLDVLTDHRVSAVSDQIRNLENILQCEPYIPRPQTFRSLSVGDVDQSKGQNVNEPVESAMDLPSLLVANSISKSNNIIELEISSEGSTTSPSNNTSQSNVTIIEVSTENKNENTLESSGDSDSEPPKLPSKTKTTIADVFKFPDTHVSVTRNIKQHEYKSNVQIIPSSSINSNSSNSYNHNNNSAHIISNSLRGGNQYTTPVKKPLAPAAKSCGVASTAKVDEISKITTVHVGGSDNTYGTCFTPALSSSTTSCTSTPKMPKKTTILSANSSGITNISVNTSVSTEELVMDTMEKSTPVRKNSVGGKKGNNFTTSSTATTNVNGHGALHYEKVFLSTTASVNATDLQTAASLQNSTPQSTKWSLSVCQSQSKLRAKEDVTVTALKKLPATPNIVDKKDKSHNTPTKHSASELHQKSPTQTHQQMSNRTASLITLNSPGMTRRRFVSPTNSRRTQPVTSARSPFLLTRGVTEAVITSRPSRRDFQFLNKHSAAKTKSSNINSNNSKSANTCNNNENSLASSTLVQIPNSAHLNISRTTSEALEQRRRSSSTSDAQCQRYSRSTNNNDSSNRANVFIGGPLRQPPQPFRLTENILGSSPGNLPTHNVASPAKRMTLREQQVMQLRREIMHPGGVRLQLRRKDCVGSIAWVDAFDAVWVAGWKQKEHPVLYNALHIGDQLLSIAGITINSAADANKIIRNSNTLFVEVLIRRIPFGRGYAIGREREGQCLGLIRDGNTATIVDVVPNSLAARHGLPPKAQSCGGSTLTFWVLTEINGRPLNLFFKENEIRDRLNSVGRDISILVQPSDLITKLKKQLKSLRGYKDYLVH